jgi:hypothetical protein
LGDHQKSPSVYHARSGLQPDNAQNTDFGGLQTRPTNSCCETNFTLLTLEWQSKEGFPWSGCHPLFMQGGKRPKQSDYHMGNFAKKVTIILLISFQLSYNKVDKDLYNPNWITCSKVFFCPKRSNKAKGQFCMKEK